MISVFNFTEIAENQEFFLENVDFVINSVIIYKFVRIFQDLKLNFINNVKMNGQDEKKKMSGLVPGAKLSLKRRNEFTGSLPETIIFNIGGTKFETFKSTLKRHPNHFLADEYFLKRHFRKETGDYFFDRDPDIFKVRNTNNRIERGRRRSL